MKKSVVMKIFLVMLVSALVMLNVSGVKAVDNTTGFDDLTKAVGNNTSSNNTNSTNTANNTAKNNTSLNTGAVGNTASNTSSTYNNTSLPKTGVEDSMPTMLLLVVFGISAVYAYKKIRDYKNI